MKQLLQLAGVLYVAFALATAHSALAPFKKPTQTSVNSRSVLESRSDLVRDNQRLDFTYTETAEIDKSKYTVEVWTASWCGPCKRYKRFEVPKLEKLEFTVIIKDIDQEKPPKEVKKIPTVRIYYKGEYLTQNTYWQAKDINKYVENRVSLKK